MHFPKKFTSIIYLLYNKSLYNNPAHVYNDQSPITSEDTKAQRR